MSYDTWKASVVGKRIDIDNSGDFDCVDIPKSWAVYLFGNWTTTLGYGNAKDIYANANPKYWQKIPNDKTNASQLPQQGDVMVFGPTPASGYTNQTQNPYGHTGVVDSATSSGYTIIQQASGTNAAASARYWAWKYRPCIGWLRPIAQVTAPPAQGEDMAMTADFVTKMYQYVGGRTPTKSEIDGQVKSGTPASLLNGFIANHDTAVERLGAQITTLEAQVKSLTATVTTLQKNLDSLNQELATADDDNADLKKTNEALTTRQAELNKIIQVQQNQLLANNCTTSVSIKQAVRVLVQAFKDWIK